MKKIGTYVWDPSLSGFSISLKIIINKFFQLKSGREILSKLMLSSLETIWMKIIVATDRTKILMRQVIFGCHLMIINTITSKQYDLTFEQN